MDLSRKQMRGNMIGFRIKYWRRQDKEDASVFYLSRSTRNEALIVGLMPDVTAFLISLVQFFRSFIPHEQLVSVKKVRDHRVNVSSNVRSRRHR